MDKTYVALYTHQKNKKAKTWQDGLLKVLSTGTKAVLYDEKGGRLDALHLHASDVRPGEQLESDKYYILVEEECARVASQPLPAISRDDSCNSSHHLNAASQQEKDKNAQSTIYGGSASRRVVAGLKRKRNGFNPPRLVRPRQTENPAAGSDESCSPHQEQTLPSLRVQKLSSWNAAAQQSSSLGFLGNRSGMIHKPERHTRSLTVSTVPKIFVREGSPGMERMDDAEKEASSLMSPIVSNSNLTIMRRNSPWRVFGSPVSGSISSSLSQKKEDLPLEELEKDISSKQLQTEPQVSANLSQFCSEIGISDNICLPSAPSISKVDDATSNIGIKSFSKKWHDERDQERVQERFLACDAEQLKADRQALKRSTAEIMALLQGYRGSTPKKPGSNILESCPSNRNKAELFSKNVLQSKRVEFSPSGTQTNQFSSSSFPQNYGDVGCMNDESHLHKKLSSAGDSVWEHTMLQKMSNNVLSEQNSRSSSFRNSLNLRCQLSPVNCLDSSISDQVSEHSGDLTTCDKRLESQSKDVENIFQYQAVLENTVGQGGNFILNDDVLENMAEHDENFIQISGVSENTSKHDKNVTQKDEVLKNNIKEAPYSHDIALGLPAVSFSSVESSVSEPCSIFKQCTRIKHEKDTVADLVVQRIRQPEVSSQEWHGHRFKLIDHQSDDSKQVCKLFGTTSVAERDKRNHNLSNTQNKLVCVPERTDAASKEDDAELQSCCFDLSFSPLSQELSNDNTNEAEPAPILPVLDNVEGHAVNLKNTASHRLWDDGDENAQFETQIGIREDGSRDSVLQRKKHMSFNVVCGNRDQEDKLSIKCRKEEPAVQCSETELNELKVEVNLGRADTNTIHAEDKHCDKNITCDSEIHNSTQSEASLRKMAQIHRDNLGHSNTTCPVAVKNVNTAACFDLSNPKLKDSFGNSLGTTEPMSINLQNYHDQSLAGNISQNVEGRCEGTVISSISTEEHRTTGQVCETRVNNANGKGMGPKNAEKSLAEKNRDGGVHGLANVTCVPENTAYEKESFEAKETTAGWKTLIDIDMSPEGVFTCSSSQFEESRSIDKFTHSTVQDNERLGNQECGAEIMLRGLCKGASSNLELSVTKDKISLQDVCPATNNVDDNNSSISQKSESSTRDVINQLSALSQPSSPASLFTDSDITFKSMLKKMNTVTQLESSKLCSSSHVESHKEHLSLRVNSNDLSCCHETEADNPSHSFENRCPQEIVSALDDAAMAESFHHSNLSCHKQECKSSLEASSPEDKDGESAALHPPVYQFFQTVSDVIDSEECVLHSFASREEDSQLSATSPSRLGQDENLDASLLTNRQGGLVLEGQSTPPSSGSIKSLDGLADVEEPVMQTIAEVVSAKLTGYKVQGMVSSDIVRRHLLPRPALSNMRHSSLSLPTHDWWTQRDAKTENVDPKKLRIRSTLEVESNKNKEINNMVDLFSVKRNNDTTIHSWYQQRDNDGLSCMDEQKSERIDYWSSKATDHSLCLMPPIEDTVCLSLAEPEDVKDKNVKSSVMFYLEPKSPNVSSLWTPEARLQSFSDADSEDPDKSFFLDQSIGKPHLVKSPHISMQYDTIQNVCYNHERSLQVVPNAFKDVKHRMDASQKHEPLFVTVGDQYNKIAKRSISVWSPQRASLSGLTMQVCGRKYGAGTLSPKVPEFEVHEKDTNIKCLDSTQTSLKPETSGVDGALHQPLSQYSGCKDFNHKKQGLQRHGYTGQQNLSVNGNIGRNLSSRIHPFGTKTSMLELTREENSFEPLPTQCLSDIQMMHTSEAVTDAYATMLGVTGCIETTKKDGEWTEESKVPGSISLEKEELTDLCQDANEVFSDSDFGNEACVQSVGKVDMGVNSSSLVDRSSSDMQVQRRESKTETVEGSPVCLFSGLPKREKQTQNSFLSPSMAFWNDALDKSLHIEDADSSYKGKVYSDVGHTVPQGIEDYRKEKINSHAAHDDDADTVPDCPSLKLKVSRLFQKFPLTQLTCRQIKQNKVDYQALGHAENTARNSKNSSTETCLPTTETDVLLLPSTQPDSPPLDLSPTHLLDPDTLLVLEATSLTPLLGTSFQGDQAGARQQTTYGVQDLLSMGPKRPYAEVEASKKIGLAKFKKPSLVLGSCWPSSQQRLCHELLFPNKEDVENQVAPLRQVKIPTSFDSALTYKNTLIAAVTEHLNVQLFDLAKSYHSAMAGIDLSEFTADAVKSGVPSAGNTNPACKCGIPSKVVQVKKEGPNKGRLFYACPCPRDKQCKFFQWLDQTGPVSTTQQQCCKSQSTTALDCRRTKLGDGDSIMTYCQGHSLSLYCQCLFVIRAEDRFHKQGNHQRIKPRQWDEKAVKKNIYIKLPKKISSVSARDDLWIISRSLSFGHQETFVACSTFHGPNANGEVAVEPLYHFLPSVWNDGCLCHALHAGNAATELGCITNLREHVNMITLPILPHLLTNVKSGGRSENALRGGFKAPLATDPPSKLHLPAQYVKELADEFIKNYKLNPDQGTALQKVADMMNKDSASLQPILLVHGVFGAGKSFLLSVLILFVVELFQRNESYTPGVPFPWKLLLSSTTNVAVDRVLQGLLDLGFEDFVRVGSVKKIAKPVLPYSVHATGTDSQELKDLQEMLLSNSITPAEKHFVKKSIERHRLGENRKRLGAVHVVGVTCAAASFQCLDKLQFPFVVLDEASQMTEPASLLPIARFGCEKLVLVGDPKQLDPTLQGSEPAHSEGLEQTLFDRMMKMGYEPAVLRTQYRCHPVISAVANTLFYHHQLVDGITALDRQPLLDLLPTLCFYDVSAGQERSDSSGSFFNEAEARFVVLLLKVLLAQGMTASTVGVITLYKAQAFHILDIIRSCGSNWEKEMSGVQVSTVDAFQGGERNVIILSCVRTHSLGFIDSDKRMNVALTRARHHLLIVGNQRNLTNNVRWATVIKYCEGLQDGIVAASRAARRLEAILEESSESHIIREKGRGSGSAKQTFSCPARARNATPTQIAHPYELELQEDVSVSEDALHTALPHGSVPFLSASSSTTSYLPLGSQISGANFMSADYDNGQEQTRPAGLKRPRRLLAQPIVIEEDVTSDNDELPEVL